MRRLLVIACLFAAGCGSSPVAPAPANVAGSWSGTLQYNQTGGASLVAVVMALNQAGSAVSGTWAIQTANGTVSGATTAGSFAGTLTFNATSTIGTSCSGTFSASGGAGATTMTWTSPGVSGNCTNLPTGMTFIVQRR